MENGKNETKICKYCQTEIPKKAKVCPQCRKKVKGGKGKWIILAIIAVLLISAVTGGEEESGTLKTGEVSQGKVQSIENKNSENAEEETVSHESTEESAEEIAAEEVVDVQTVYHVGDILKDGNLEIVYMSSGEYSEGNEYMQPTEGKKYIYIQLAFENTSATSDASVSTFNFECYADGYSVDMYYGAEDTLSSTLSAGRSTSGYLYFEVPEDAHEIEIEYETNLFTEDKITFVYEGDLDSGYVVEANTAVTEGALKPGEITESDQLKIVYISCFSDSSDNMFINPKEGYHYITCEFEFENLSDSDQFISSIEFDCFADGIACEQVYFREDELSATLSSGRKTKGTVSFEVPDAAQTVEVEYLSNYWTSKRVVFAIDESK